VCVCLYAWLERSAICPFVSHLFPIHTLSLIYTQVIYLEIKEKDAQRRVATHASSDARNLRRAAEREMSAMEREEGNGFARGVFPAPGGPFR
jgi:hypothetical protein